MANNRFAAALRAHPPHSFSGRTEPGDRLWTSPSDVAIAPPSFDFARALEAALARELAAGAGEAGAVADKPAVSGSPAEADDESGVAGDGATDIQRADSTHPTSPRPVSLADAELDCDGISAGDLGDELSAQELAKRYA